MKADDIRMGMILFRKRQGGGGSSIVRAETKGIPGGTWVRPLYHRNAFGNWRQSTGSNFRCANRDLTKQVEPEYLEQVRAAVAAPVEKRDEQGTARAD